MISLSVLMIFLSAFFSCGPKPGFKKQNVPYEMKVETRSGGAVLSWQVNRQGNRPISGYNVYIAEFSYSDAKLYNSTPYPGDTDGDINHESIELVGLENGRKYYAYIRTVFPDGELSQPSTRIEFVPLSQGRLEISQNHTTGQSGYSFDKERYTQARDYDSDFYIYATADRIGISSPSRLHSGLRKTLINTTDSSINKPFSETQVLVNGETYILKTADGGTALLTVVRILGKSPNIKAVLDFLYYPPGVRP